MNKKFSLNLLIGLIAMIFIHNIASVISNISGTLAFRTSERIKETSRFKINTKETKEIKQEMKIKYILEK